MKINAKYLSLPALCLNVFFIEFFYEWNFYLCFDSMQAYRVMIELHLSSFDLDQVQTYLLREIQGLVIQS